VRLNTQPVIEYTASDSTVTRSRGADADPRANFFQIRLVFQKSKFLSDQIGIPESGSGNSEDREADDYRLFFLCRRPPPRLLNS